MKITNIELKDKVVGFAMPSSIVVEFEKKEGSLFNALDSISFTKIVTLLKYMRRYEKSDFGFNEACDLLDELLDNGYTLNRIADEIVFPVYESCGLLTKADLTKADEKEADEKATGNL